MTNSAPDRCCDETRQNIPWHVNGTLSGPADVALREHVKGCSDCQADLRAHADMRAAVLGRQLTPMIPANRAEDIIGASANGLEKLSRSRQVPSRLIAVAASLAVLGIALLLTLYPAQDTEVSNQLFQTATSAGSSDGIDYVLQLRLEDHVAETDGGRIASQLEGAIKWTVDENGVYEVRVRLAAPSLQALQEYEKDAEALEGVQSARFTALQLPIR